MLRFRQARGAGIFPRGFDQSATDDSTVAPVGLSTATDDPVIREGCKAGVVVPNDVRLREPCARDGSVG